MAVPAMVWSAAAARRNALKLIALGLVMLMQPWSIELFSYGFTVLLVGVIGFSIAGKLPQRS